VIPHAVMLVAAVSCSAAPLAAIEAKVAGRPVELSGHLEVRQVLKANPSTPGDRTLEELWAHVEAPLDDFIRLQTTFTLQNGGPTTRSTNWGVYGYHDVFQSISPSFELEEAFLDANVSDFDVRLGKQKFAWGKLDRFQPVDVLNTERYNDPFMLEEEERKIGVPAAEVSYYLPDRAWAPSEGRLTVVWIPRYFPFRFPRDGERWFPPAAVPPDTFSVPENSLGFPQGNPAFEIPIEFRTRNSPPPGFRMENAGYAARFSAFARGVDYALYYYHGFDAEPAFHLGAEAFATPDQDAALGFDVAARTELSPIFRTIDLWGADAAYTWGSFTFRAEGAYVKGRPFTRDLSMLVEDPSELAPQIRDALLKFLGGATSVPIDLGPSFVARDAIEWGIGADYTVAGYLLLAQINQTDVLNNHEDLLIRDVDSRLLVNLRKSFWHDDLGLQLIGLYGIESDYTLLLPRATYRVWEGVELRVGYLFIAGRKSSVIGQYKRGDQGFLRLRYLF
jgi:hypothetical protein